MKDIAAERAVLAGMCQYGLDAYLEVDFLTSQSFTDPMNQLIFDCVYKSISDNTTVELSSILSVANDLGVAEQINSKDEIGFIRSLFNFPIVKENIGKYGVKVAKLQLSRDLLKTLEQSKQELLEVTGDEDVMDIVARIEEPLLDATGDIYKSSSKKSETIGEGLEDSRVAYTPNPVTAARQCRRRSALALLATHSVSLPHPDG